MIRFLINPWFFEGMEVADLIKRLTISICDLQSDSIDDFQQTNSAVKKQEIDEANTNRENCVWVMNGRKIGWWDKTRKAPAFRLPVQGKAIEEGIGRSIVSLPLWSDSGRSSSQSTAKGSQVDMCK